MDCENSYVLELEKVSEIIDGNLIIDDLSWKIRNEEHWAMLGPNGAGKTMLMEIITGYRWPTEGKVSVLGKEFGNVDLRELRKRIGYVNSVLLNKLPSQDTVSEVVLSGKFASLGLYDTPSDEDLKQVEDYLGMMDCRKFIDKEFGKLSQGEQQKILISRALMPKPSLLVLDEPALGLDPAAREKFLEKIEKIGKIGDGPTIIYITHHIEELMPIFNKLILLKNGRVVAKGEKEKILTDKTLSRTFDMKAEIIRKDDRYLLSG